MTVDSARAAGGGRGARRRAGTAATPPRVGMFGLLGQGSLGNDASMEAVLFYLRAQHPEVIVDALCSGPDAVASRFGIPAAPLRWYQPDRPRAPGLLGLGQRGLATCLGICIDAIRISSWVRRHDAVIVPGMGVFETSLPTRPWRTPYWMFLLCASGRQFGTQVALVSVGASVSHRRLTRWLITTAARRAQYRSFRDTGSRDAMRLMGVDTSADPVYPDVVFGLPVPRESPSVPGSVGVGVMDYSGGNEELAEAGELRANYVAQMKRFVSWLVDNGRPIRLLTSDTADEPVAREVADHVRAYRPDLDPSWVIAEPASSLTELMVQMAPVDTVVCTRFHNVLTSLMLAKPTLAVGYAAKHEVLITDAGLAGFFLPCKSLDASELIERFTELERRSSQLVPLIAGCNTAKVELVDRQLAEMSAVLFPSSGAVRVGVGVGSKVAQRGAR